jgi:Asp-tRNA(Asn)/Glu-tRNA(Gln) amidotransferase A subunit family amidase
VSEAAAVETSNSERVFAEARALLDDYRADPATAAPAFVAPPAPGPPPDRPMAPPIEAALGGRIGTAARSLARGEVGARGLVEEALAAVDARNEELGAIVALDRERSRAAALALDAEGEERGPRSPLHGIPISFKDNIDVAGLPTTGNSAAYLEDDVPDSWVAARLRALGANPIAKTACHEFALGISTPQAHNPHDPTRMPGGSSGGSAIAVATGMSLASIGTDTRASVRIPACLCGVSGFKPGLGTIPTEGVIPLSWSMDHVGVLAATAADAALVGLALIEVPASPAAVEGLSIGVPETALEGADEHVAAGFAIALAALAEICAGVTAGTGPEIADLDASNAAGLVISRCEASVFHTASGTDRSLYWQETQDQLNEADRVSGHDLIKAFQVRGEVERRMAEIFEHQDVLVTPTSPVIAPPLSKYATQLTRLSRQTILWSTIGYPCFSLPMPSPGSPMPVGIQLIGPPGSDATLAALAIDLEAAFAAAS